jgi:hypothetical protein
MGKRSAPRIAIFSAVLTLVAGGVGLVAMLVLNAFVLDRFDAYGEVPIPGSASMELPEGDVTVSFHTMITGRPSSGFPIPDLKFSIIPPDGAPEPQVTESLSGTTTVNSDLHVQVWVVQVHQAGTYNIATEGNVNGYISPRLAFGHGSSYGWATWAFGGLLALGGVELAAALIWSARSAKRARPLTPDELVHQPTSYTPTDDGVRFEQLRSLAALRDSGALTADEFEAEKRRLLRGQ